MVDSAVEVCEALRASTRRRDQHDLWATTLDIVAQVRAAILSHEVNPNDDVKVGATLITAFDQECCGIASTSALLSHVIYDPGMRV